MDKIVEVSSLSKQQQRGLQLAQKMAEQSTYTQFRFGCALVKNGRLCNLAVNHKSYNAFAERFQPCNTEIPATAHAEISVVLNQPKSITNGATVYVVRINKHNQMRLAKCCEMCRAVLRFVGVKRVLYSTQDETKVGVIKL
jgi:tRNA(Arg) A34 adenosine deaminase TadA